MVTLVFLKIRQKAKKNHIDYYRVLQAILNYVQWLIFFAIKCPLQYWEPAEAKL